MRYQIGTLKRELEDRKEEPRGSPETASDGSGKVDGLDDRAVPWWRLLLGL